MKYAKLKSNVITCLTTKQSDGVVDVSELEENAIVGKNIYDCYKVFLKKALWGLLPKKVSGAKKDIIGKPDMSDEELEVQLELYRKKYDDAKAGLNVFKGQALARRMSQKDYRALVIKKGNALLTAEKVINDRIELVRSLMEDNIDKIKSYDDIESIKAKFVLVNGFSIGTSVKSIANSLKS